MDHQDLLASIWESLRAATTQRTGFTLATLATVTAAGQPRARSVIIRDFATDPERVYFATHTASDKLPEMLARPTVALMFYDAATSVQLRAEGQAQIIEDPAERHRVWDTLAPHSRELYAPTAPPGTPLETADAPDARTAFERFAWISIRLDRLDWLDLATDPHQRWQFQRTGTTWTGHPVVP
ncbi:hypothetical protein GCM10023190_20730 [Enteractinococcus fodinae]|uniref:Pyridoxamine 5'-phosphate oxidase N-terminal domain-containing protein n=1 Tax=Enteractinococcus fodinae TaxID=684663 RepID=A0ABU2B4H5_9MICC|nr:pyridoxamine 5'-phosphate oxidase family protein [Enteractinococcus fodinae]MDR7348166.1 hypothetical protein [Enteractinococcus fodinae]